MPDKLILLIVAIVPALWLLRYYYKQDKAKPEPKKLVTKVFLWGFVLVIPAVILEKIMSQLLEPFTGGVLILSIFARAFIVAGLIEEWLKRYAVKKVAYTNPYFDEVMDGIVYAVVASLGFATIENIFYVMEGGLSTAIARAFTALPLHAITAGIMGYYIGKAKFAETKFAEHKFFAIGLQKAVIIHGVYDFTVFTGARFSTYIFIALPFILIFGFLYLRKLIKLAIMEDREMGRHEFNTIYNQKNESFTNNIY